MKYTTVSIFSLALVSTMAAAQSAMQPLDCGVHATLIASSHAQGYLGVDIRDVTDEQVSQLRLKDAHGAEITRVDHDGPAGKAGLREHDVILAVNGQLVEGEDQLRHILRETPAGRTITLIISRDGQQQTLKAEMANRAEVEKKAWSQHFVVPEPQGNGQIDQQLTFRHEEGPISRFGDKFLPSPSILLGMPKIGVTLDAMEPQLAEFFGAPSGKGLLIRSVESNSPAANAGLKAGDVVTKVNGNQVASRNDFLRSLRDGKGKPVAVTVLRDKKEQTLTVDLDSKKKSEADPRDLPGTPGGARAMLFQAFPTAN